MTPDISSFSRVQLCKTHVPPLTSIPLQVEQDEQIESKDGDQWELQSERHIDISDTQVSEVYADE